MTTANRSQMAGFFSVAITVIWLLLVIVAFWNWRSATMYELAWLMALLGSTFIRAPYVAKNKNNSIVNDRHDTGEKLMLIAMYVTMMVLPLLHFIVGKSYLSFASYVLPQWAQVVGTALLPAYLWMFWRSHADLGQNWSAGLEVREDHKLITQGIYKHIRHPMYAAIWLGALSQPLLLQNWITGALVVPAFAAMYFIRVPREEAMMRDEFGTDYDTYIQNSGRVLPRLS